MAFPIAETLEDALSVYDESRGGIFYKPNMPPTRTIEADGENAWMKRRWSWTLVQTNMRHEVVGYSADFFTVADALKDASSLNDFVNAPSQLELYHTRTFPDMYIGGTGWGFASTGITLYAQYKIADLPPALWGVFH